MADIALCHWCLAAYVTKNSKVVGGLHVADDAKLHDRSDPLCPGRLYRNRGCNGVPAPVAAS